MNKAIKAALLVTATTFCLSSAQAAEVKGDVKSNVAVGAVIQSNTGIANKNEANLGSVTGKSTSVGGDVTTNVAAGAIIQKNTGIANKNEVNLGSVTD